MRIGLGVLLEPYIKWKADLAIPFEKTSSDVNSAILGEKLLLLMVNTANGSKKLSIFSDKFAKDQLFLVVWYFNSYSGIDFKIQ